MNILLAMGQPQGEGGGGGDILGMLIPFAAIFLIFYFMIIRPQQKRSKERQSMIDAVKKGDKVVTNGGIHGVVAGIDDKTVLLQVSDNVKLKLDRSAIGSVISSKGNQDS